MGFLESEKKMKSDVYSSFKVAHHKEKLEQLKRGELPLPAFVQWDISNRCNLNCNFCFYKIFPLSDWDPNAIMPTDIILRTLDEVKELGVKAIEWTGGGSVETHPDYKKILKYSQELGFENALVTNGTLLDDEALDIIKDFEWVRFSIDAVTPKTYKKIKGKDLFDKAIENLRKLIEIKKSTNVIGYSFIVCPDNYQEIYHSTLLAKQLGCDNIRFSIALTPDGEKPFLPIWDECVKQINLAKSLEDKNFKVFPFPDRIKDISGERTTPHCYFHHFCAVIAPTGMYPCCRLKDYKEFNLGNLKEKSFKEIWFGEKRKKFIKSIKDGCNYPCWMTEKNAFIHYLLKDNPQHVNFI